jgi:hypothetical protein
MTFDRRDNDYDDCRDHVPGIFLTHRMSGAVTARLLCVFLACTGTNLPCTFCLKFTPY